MGNPKWWISIVLVAALAFAAIPAINYVRNCETRWEGETDSSMVAQVRADIAWAEAAQCRVLRIELFSPGGSIVSGLEIIREMRSARERGIVLEIRGGAVVASMATAILSAGTPGYRYVDLHTLTVIHSIRSRMGSGCIDYIDKPANEEEKLTNQLILTLAKVLAETTRNDLSVTRGWLKCGSEQVGDGMLLLKLHIADKIS